MVGTYWRALSCISREAQGNWLSPQRRRFRFCTSLMPHMQWLCRYRLLCAEQGCLLWNKETFWWYLSTNLTTGQPHRTTPTSLTAATIANVYFFKTTRSYHDKKITEKGLQNFCEHMTRNDTVSVTLVLSTLKSTERKESKHRTLTRECLVRQFLKIKKKPKTCAFSKHWKIFFHNNQPGL